MQKTILKVKDLSISSKETGVKLLKNVSFEINTGEIHCILGKNGSGKSTVAYALMGIDRYRNDKGSIRLNDKDITKLKTYERARLGMSLAFQEPARFEGLTVRDFMRAGNKTASEKDLAGIFDLMGLKKELLDRRLDEKLSGGERKRIEIASVIMMKPKLLIMDEPDASLDIIVYNEFYDLLLRIKKELGCSILLITHREEAGLVADKATLIDGGSTVKTGTFKDVMGEYCKRMGRKEACQRIRPCTTCNT